MTRTRIPAENLLALIAERMRLADGGTGPCAGCAPTQLAPIKPVAGGINWQVLEHPRCPAPCQALMLDVCSALADEYDVQWPAKLQTA